MLTLKHLGGDSLQVQAACLLSTFFSIAIPAKYKVTESTYDIVSYYALTNETTCCVSNIVLVDCIGCFHS